MNQVEQVIILGAGASKSEGMPLQNELFKKFFKYYLKKDRDKLIMDFFRDFWGMDESNYHIPGINFPTFEECLGTLDWAYSRGETLKGYSQEKINKIRDGLVFLIAKVLDESLKNKVSHHANLLERLSAEDRLGKTAFVSLNYDIVIDNVFMDRYGYDYIDYGIDFINCFNKSMADSNSLNKSSILLFKIHGSLNWLYCSTCSHMKIMPQEKQAVRAFYKKEECNACGMSMKPIMIPPTFYKQMNNPFIQKIFLKADKLLRNAPKILICGYSLPDADMHIKYLLKRAEMFQGTTPEIHIINYHDDKKNQEKEDEKIRFFRFFKNKDKIFYHDNLSFEKFASLGLTN